MEFSSVSPYIMTYTFWNINILGIHMISFLLFAWFVRKKQARNVFSLFFQLLLTLPPGLFCLFLSLLLSASKAFPLQQYIFKLISNQWSVTYNNDFESDLLLKPPIIFESLDFTSWASTSGLTMMGVGFVEARFKQRDRKWLWIKYTLCPRYYVKYFPHMISFKDVRVLWTLEESY